MSEGSSKADNWEKWMHQKNNSAFPGVQNDETSIDIVIKTGGGQNIYQLPVCYMLFEKRFTNKKFAKTGIDDHNLL